MLKLRRRAYVSCEWPILPTSYMNLLWFSHRWFYFMQFVNVFISLMLSFGFDVGGYYWFQIRVGDQTWLNITVQRLLRSQNSTLVSSDAGIPRYPAQVDVISSCCYLVDFVDDVCHKRVVFFQPAGKPQCTPMWERVLNKNLALIGYVNAKFIPLVNYRSSYPVLVFGIISVYGEVVFELALNLYGIQMDVSQTSSVLTQAVGFRHSHFGLPFLAKQV